MNRSCKLLTVLLAVTVLTGVYSSLSAYTSEELALRMLDTNHELRQNEHAVIRSTLEIDRARARRHPQITGSVSAAAIANPMEAVIFDPSVLLGSGEPIELVPPQAHSYYQLQVSLTQPLYTWGRITGAIALQELMRSVSSSEVDRTIEQLHSRLLIVLDTLAGLEKIEQLLLQQQLLVRRLLEITEQNYESGFVLKDEVLKVGIRVSELELAVQQIASRQQLLLYDLQQLTGVRDLKRSDIVHELDLQQIRQLDIPSLKEQEYRAAASDRPLFTMLDTVIAVRRTAVEIADDSIYWKPDIALSVDFSYGGSHLPILESGWYEANDYALNAALALQFTFWDGGSKLIDREAAELALEEAGDERRQAVEQVLHTYRTTIARLELEACRAAYYEQKMASDQETILFREQQYAEGLGEQSDLITARIALLADQISYHETLLQMAGEYRTLQSLLGEGASQ